MVFNDTATKQGALQDCEFLCQFGDGDISGNSTLRAVFTRLINKHNYKTVTAILDAQDGWDFDDRNFTDYPIATTPLVAGQRDYTFPVSLKILKIKRVDITYDGTNWYQATARDSGAMDIPLGNATNEDTNFTFSSPVYDVKANAVWVYPMATSGQVSAGAKIRIEFFREIYEFSATDTTQEIGFDKPFHQMVTLGASVEYAVAKNLPNAKSLFELYSDMEKRLRTYYGKKDISENFQLTPAMGNYK
jgi:hypothetical protein